MNILLTDKEIMQAVVEADREIWAFKVHPRWEGEKYLMKVQLKKVVKWLEGHSEWADKVFFGTGYERGRLIDNKDWQALLKEVGENEGS